ncbi:MAG: right-handed parallel beta-helix repeat-containing protein [Anaerolineales bacterium]
MSSRIRAFLLSLTIVAVLVFSTVGTTTAYADGETPPEPVPTEPAVEPVDPETVTVDTVVSDPTETALPDDTGLPVEEAATPVPTEEVAPAEGEATPLPTEEGAPAEGEATPAPVEETAPPAEEVVPAVEEPILDAVPENTTVTVLNAEGESQPLATQEAADAIATTTDPIWCPAAQAPTPGANGCTPSFTSFTALLQHLESNPTTYSGAGTIYVEAGAAQGGASVVDFNNYNLSNISNADLSITGGWNTSTGAIDPNTPSTFSDTSFIIGSSTNPWAGSLSISNISISGSSQTGITAYSVSDINLNNVSVTGAENGVELDAGNDVSINNSKFNKNKTVGATIRAVGDVSIANSSFSNLDPNARQQDVGLYIINDGSVSLFSVVATGNRRVGAHIDSGGRVTIGGTETARSIFSGTMELVESTQEFLGYGLQITTTDAIDLNYVTGNDNFLWGAMLTADGDVTIANSIFNANTTEDPGFIDDTGLLVFSGGNVSILNTQANDNRLIGATIEAAGDVSISNSQFSNNNGITGTDPANPTYHGLGLQIVTQGNIFLNGVTASDNTLFGALLDAGLDVVVSNSTFNNNTTGSLAQQLGHGLDIVSDGNVFLDTVAATGNQTYGANIQAAGDVFLDSVTATNNGTNGVEVELAGCTTVFLINGTYTGNGQYGLTIVNGLLNQSGGVFSGNGVGDILHTTTCTAPVAPTTPTTPTTNPEPPQGVNALASVTKASFMGTDASGVFKSSFGTLSTKNVVTLNSFLANTRLASGGHVGLFFGKYAFVYFSDGSMQIIMLSPNSLDGLAMGGS